MEKSVLIADARDVVRKGIKSIFVEDVRVCNIYEAVTQEECMLKLLSCRLDLVVISQLLVSDKALFTKGNVVVLAAKPDIIALQMAFNYGARAYLLENVSATLLRSTLDLVETAFLIEPSLSAYLLDDLSSMSMEECCSLDALLTSREREIIRLLRYGVGRHDIALRLHISEATLKVHLRNITRKTGESK